MFLAPNPASTEATGSATVMAPLKEQESVQVASPPRKKIAVKKKPTPRKDVCRVAADPSSPAANTRGKKNLQLG